MLVMAGVEEGMSLWLRILWVPQAERFLHRDRQEWSTGGFQLERGKGGSLALVACTMASGSSIEKEVSRKPR